MQFVRDKGMFLLLLLAALLVLAIAILLATPTAMAGPGSVQAYEVPWDVVASGGATMSSASYTIMGTAGQPAAGPSSSSSYELLSGYWQALEELMRQVFMPIQLGQPATTLSSTSPLETKT